MSKSELASFTSSVTVTDFFRRKFGGEPDFLRGSSRRYETTLDEGANFDVAPALGAVDGRRSNELRGMNVDRGGAGSAKKRDWKRPIGGDAVMDVLARDTLRKMTADLPEPAASRLGVEGSVKGDMRKSVLLVDMRSRKAERRVSVSLTTEARAELGFIEEREADGDAGFAGAIESSGGGTTSGSYLSDE